MHSCFVYVKAAFFSNFPVVVVVLRRVGGGGGGRDVFMILLIKTKTKFSNLIGYRQARFEH